MSKLLTITTTYDETLRELKTVLLMNGFIVDVPAQDVGAQEIDTTTLFADPVMSPSDQRGVMQSVARALLTANIQLGQWVSAEANKDKSDAFIAAETDPVDTFDQILNPSTVPPITDDAGVLAFEAALNPPA